MRTRTLSIKNADRTWILSAGPATNLDAWSTAFRIITAGESSDETVGIESSAVMEQVGSAENGQPEEHTYTDFGLENAGSDRPISPTLHTHSTNSPGECIIHRAAAVSDSGTTFTFIELAGMLS